MLLKNLNPQNIYCSVADDMCSGCGFCAALCPTASIKIVRDHMGFYVPKVFAQRCKGCGICLRVCPSYPLPAERSLVPSEAPFYNPLLGRFAKVYVGFACDLNVRFNASSAGIVTSLLLYLLKKGYVNGAIVTIIDDQNPLCAKTILATSEEEILKAMGAKYAPVTMDKALNLLMRKGGRYAFVGLPCHIEALRRAQRRFDKLKSLIIFTIGLYCNNVPGAHATKYVLWLNKIPTETVMEIKYRGCGWPGEMFIKLKDNANIRIPFTKYWNSGFGQFFCKKRCIVCSDHTAELSDISVADPWTIPSVLNSERIGQSIVVARTPQGCKILKEAHCANFISLKESQVKTAIQLATLLKKRNKSSQSVKMLLGLRKIPIYKYTLPLNLGTAMWLFEYRLYSFLANREKLWPLFKFLIFIRSLRFITISTLARLINKIVGNEVRVLQWSG